MSEHIGIMIAHEQPQAPLDVALLFVEAGLKGELEGVEVRNGLAGLEDVRLHIAELRAERDDLRERRGKVEAVLEEANKMLVAAMEQSHRDARKLQEQSVMITGLRAKLEDLHDKYVGAQEELHGLRIKTKWEPVGDNVPIICACADSECHITIRAIGGKVLRMESSPGLALDMVLPSDVRLMICP